VELCAGIRNKFYNKVGGKFKWETAAAFTGIAGGFILEATSVQAQGG